LHRHSIFRIRFFLVFGNVHCVAQRDQCGVLNILRNKNSGKVLVGYSCPIERTGQCIAPTDLFNGEAFNVACGERYTLLDLVAALNTILGTSLEPDFGERRAGDVMHSLADIDKGRQLLGYDPRAYKLATFTIGGALAGFAGCLFANWGNFVSPTIFGLSQSAQIIIWVLVGGRGTLIGPVVGCIGIQWLNTALGANQPSGGSDWWAKIFANAPLILGSILIAFVLLVPKGIVPTLGDWGLALLRLRGRRATKRLEPTAAE